MQLNPVFLVRHGETLSNRAQRYSGRSDEPLTAVGRAQVDALADDLVTLGVGLIWTSPVARAQETGAILGSKMGVPVDVDPRLDEIAMGPWEGMTEEEVAATYPQSHALWMTEPDRLRLPGRETLVDVAARIMEAVSEGARSLSRVVMVTHVAPIRVAILATLREPLSAYKKLRAANSACFRLDLERHDVCRIPGGESVATELRCLTLESWGRVE